MTFLDSTTKRFGLRIVLPAILILVGTFATVVVSLQQMAGEVDRTESELTARSTRAAVQTFVRRVGESNGDYAHWDDAVRKLYGTPDPTFVAENFQASTAQPVFFDTAYLLDENGRDLFGYHDGALTTVPSIEAFGRGLDDLVAGLPADGRTYDTHVGMIAGEWGLMAISVGPVVPTSADFADAPAHSRFLVLGKTFDADAVKRLGEDFVIDGLHIVEGSVAPAAEVAVTDPAGKAIASLAWSAPRLGSEAHAKVSSPVFLMLAVLGLTMVLLIAVAMRGLREIQRGGEAAYHAATHDGLTGLPNRTRLVEAVNAAIAGKRQNASTVAVVYLDLDGFKAVNDAYGHETGDRLLQRIAGDFRAVCTDRLLARIGGDEFAVLVDETGGVRAAPDLGRRLVAALSQPFDMDGRVVVVGTCVGIAIAETPDISADELLRRADVAMYQAKQEGPNRICLYHHSVDTIRHERLEIAAELRRALKSDGFGVAYQPVVDADSREIVAAEALLRWNRPNYGPVSPTVFVPIAEEAGLIDEIDAWMLRRACRDALEWPGIRLLVNVSSIHFRSPSFEPLVSSILSETGTQSRHLEIEITESLFFCRPEQIRKAMDPIRNRGIAVTLDDFGTGFSSISHLRDFGFGKIKLSRAMIAGIASDPRAQRLVQATIALADALDLKATAEGVETEAEAMMLRLGGCRELQGAFFAGPAPPSALTARLKSAASAAAPRALVSA